MFPLFLFHYFTIGAFIISVAVLYRFNNKPLRWFIPFLFFMVCAELTGRYIRKILHEPNIWLYNITIPIEYLFYGFIIGSLCLGKNSRNIVFWLLGLFALWALINLLFIQGYSSLATNNLKTGICLMIMFSGIGLIDLFKNDQHKTLLTNPLFWICTGVLFFNSGEFLYNFFFDSMLKNGWDKTASVFASINNKLIYVLYTCLSIAIVCSKTLEKKV
jgi:hypothetical protein